MTGSVWVLSLARRSRKALTGPLDIFASSWGSMGLCHIIFFFQAEDGIRDLTVTGVQTCALPISREASLSHSAVQRRPLLVSHAARCLRANRWTLDCTPIPTVS